MGANWGYCYLIVFAHKEDFCNGTATNPLSSIRWSNMKLTGWKWCYNIAGSHIKEVRGPNLPKTDQLMIPLVIVHDVLHLSLCRVFQHRHTMVKSLFKHVYKIFPHFHYKFQVSRNPAQYSINQGDTAPLDLEDFVYFLKK